MKYDLEARVFKDTTLSATEKLVMLALVFHLNEASGQCNPSNDLLEAECGLSDKGLTGVLKRLEQRHCIKWTRGVGRGNKTQFELFPQDQKGEVGSPFEAEKANDVRVLEQKKGEAGSPFSEEKANVVPEKANVVPLPPYERLRTISSSSSTTSETSSVNCVSQPGAAAQAKPSDNVPQDALTLSLCEACALMPDALGEKHRGQLLEVRVWLLSIHPDLEEAAREVAVRYAQDVWDKPKPPHLPQIRSDWARMKRLLDARNQTQNATNSNLDGSGPSRPKPQNEFARNAADRRVRRAQLRDKYSGDGGGATS